MDAEEGAGTTAAFKLPRKRNLRKRQAESSDEDESPVADNQAEVS